MTQLRVTAHVHGVVGLLLLAGTASLTATAQTPTPTPVNPPPQIIAPPYSADPEPMSINNAGTVVGTLWFPLSYQRAFVWSKSGGVVQLDSPGNAEANSINTCGRIVGSADFGSDGNPHWHAVLWNNFQIEDLGALGGSGSRGRDINDKGTVVGTLDTVLGPGVVGPRAFVRKPTHVVTVLGTLGGARSTPTAINNQDEVVGYAETMSGRLGRPHAFYWTAADGMIDLTPAIGPDSESEASDINDAGEVVGSVSDYSTGVIVRAFRWTKRGGLVFMDQTVTRDTYTGPESINSYGAVVGLGDTAYDLEAVMWLKGQALIRIPPGLGTTTIPRAINDHFMVVGSIAYGGGRAGVLWHPSSAPQYTVGPPPVPVNCGQ
jgi:probable HAF family extracellular repeat protein